MVSLLVLRETCVVALGTVVGLLTVIAVNLRVAYLSSILVIYCRLIVLAHMVIVVTIPMFELVILNGYNIQPDM